MLRVICFILFLTIFYTISGANSQHDYGSMTPIQTKESVKEERTVKVEDGSVSGQKYWDGDFYEFYGIPYASVPSGRDRFKAPLPAKKWQGVLEANDNRRLCPQTFYTGENVEEIFLEGEEDCLHMNLLVPESASEKNLVPVVIYIHSGAFAVGNGNQAKFHYLARHNIIVGSFNFRLGAIGFNCLGTEDIPGNAGMKDAVAALRWINRNIKKFGGDPKKVTLAGFSVGAAMAELLVLSKTTDGLIDKLILESGSALSSYAINEDPISTALNIAKSLNYTGGNDVKNLAEFYINAKPLYLSAKSLNFFLTNGTFGFAPCIENKIDNVEPFLTESPLEIMKRGEYKKVAVLTGFCNMEGISRIMKFDDWSEEMNKDFAKFLPADLQFDSKEASKKTIDDIKANYFNNKEVNSDNLQGYVDYFSDSMFNYPIIKSANYHAAHSKRPVYFYEFTYVGTLSLKHNYMKRIKGASHRDQSAYILDFFSFTNNIEDLLIRERMTSMWSDFVKYEDPTRYESAVIDYKWSTYSEKESHHLLINIKTTMKKDLSLKGYNFWNNIYNKYYWTPKAPVPPKPEPVTPNEESINENQKTAAGHKTETKSTETKATQNKPTDTKTAEKQKSSVPQEQKKRNQEQTKEPDSQKKKAEDKKTDEPKVTIDKKEEPIPQTRKS